MGKTLSRPHNEVFFSYFSQKTGFNISRKLSPMESICMKCLIILSGENTKDIISLPSAGCAHRVVIVTNIGNCSD